MTPTDIVAGTITLTNGSTAFVGVGTSWSEDDLRSGDLFIFIEGGEQFAPPIINTITDNLNGTLIEPWVGPTLTGVRYRARYQWDSSRVSAQARNMVQKLGNGNVEALAALTGPGVPVFDGPHSMAIKPETDFINGVAFNVQVDTLADRAAYDGQSAGFTVLVADVGDGRSAVYSKNSNTSADWSDPAYITGPVGPVPTIEAGTITTGLPGTSYIVTIDPVTGGYEINFTIPAPPGFYWENVYNPANTYPLSSVVRYNGSSFIAVQAVPLATPPSGAFPPVDTAYWEVLASKGADGTGTGDVSGPASSVDNRVAVFDGVTGKLIKDSGKPLSAVGDFNGPAGGVVDNELVLFSGTTGKLGKGSGKTISELFAIEPQGRLTLTSGSPVMASSVAASSNIYYTPFAGKTLPLHNGTRFVPTVFSELLQTTTDTTKSPAAVANNSFYDMFVWNDGGTPRLSRGPAWSSSSVRGYTLDVIDGIVVNNAAITNGPAAQRGTWVGSIMSNGTATIDWVFGASGSGGVAASFGIYNAYNRCLITTSVIDTGAGYTYSANVTRQARASAGNQVAYMQGALGEGAIADYCSAILAAASGGGNIGIGFNSSTTFYGPRQVFLAPPNSMYLPLAASAKPPANLGKNIIYALELGDGVNANTFNVTATATLSVAVML